MQKHKVLPFGEDAAIIPEVALCIAILERAVIDCCSPKISDHIRDDAFLWIFGSRRMSKPFSFYRICETIEADPERVQRMVMDSIDRGEVYTQSTLAAKQRFMK